MRRPIHRQERSCAAIGILSPHYLSPHYRLDFDFEVIAFYHGAKQPFARHDQ
jgi:hypothetical protein